MKRATDKKGRILLLLIFWAAMPAFSGAAAFSDPVYDPGRLKPVDSTLKVVAGQLAPDFTLPSVAGAEVSLSDYAGKKNVILSFVPAAWTPVCSDQWPGYNIARTLFEAHDAVLLGITVDNIPTLYAWTHQMGDLWFPVLSDFWPHGAVADRYGILRTDGVSERAVFIIDKERVLRYAKVSDINIRPPLEEIVRELERISAQTGRPSTK